MCTPIPRYIRGIYRKIFIIVLARYLVVIITTLNRFRDAITSAGLSRIMFIFKC